MSAGRFQVPYFFCVYESDAKTFGNTMFLDEHAQALNAFARGVNVGQYDVEHGIFGQTRFNQRIMF